MFIKKLEIKGIRSWVDGVIEFEEGFTVILGTKGAGKSSIIRAIVFALLGQQATGDYSTILREGAQKGYVQLQIEDQGHVYTITRGLLRKDTRIEQDPSVLKLEMDGVLIAGEKSKRVAEELTQRLGQNKEIIQSTWYVKQEALKEILNIDPRQRKIKLDRLFGFEAYNRAYDEMGGAVRHWEGRLEEQTKASHRHDLPYLETERTKIQKSLKNLNTLHKKTNRLLKTAQKKFTEIENRRNTLREAQRIFEVRENELETLKESVRDHEAYVRRNQDLISGKTIDLEKRQEICEKENHTLKTVLQDMNALGLQKREIKTIKALDSLVSKWNEKVNQIHTQIQIEKARLQDLQTQNSNIEGKEECEYCGQSLSSEQVQDTIIHRKEHITQSEEKIQQFEKHKDQKITEYDSLRSGLEKGRKHENEIETQNREIKGLKDDIKDLSQRDQGFQEDLIKERTKLDKFSLDIPVFDSTKLRKVSDQYDAAKDTKQALEQEQKDFETNILNSTTKLEGIENEIQSGKEEILKLTRYKQITDWVKSIRQSFKEVLPNLRLTSVQAFREQINDNYSQLEITPPYVDIDEHYAPIVKYGAVTRSSDGLSGGERTDLALAYRIALGNTVSEVRSGKYLQLLILDEPTENIGEADRSIQRMAEFLANARNIQQIIAITHSHVFAEFANNVIEIEKKGNQSRVKDQ
ncbi:MAG: AAA family ATPase [Candidatus Ranarchaeia archaeon]|jgi:exonuclease SbcC